jgi:endonuclease YncB( thermonuclease family)
MGCLQVDGTLDLKQFWPNGSSDGDTAHVVVKRVRFEGKPTRVFNGAHVRGRVVRNVIDENRAITVRFQGIDAPELHFMPPVSKAKAKKQNANFRQHYARAAAEALGSFLHTLGTDQVKCRVVTAVSTPNDVFDTYGRFIGNIIVTDQKGRDIDLNLWMLQHGWAFPTFYSSMSTDEIKGLRAIGARAAKKKLGIWKGYGPKLSFDHALLYSDAGSAPDAGAVSMPKIFRRLALNWVGNGNTKLHTFLVAEQSSDRCYKTDELLEEGITVAKQYKRADLVLNTDVKFGPADVVFQEAAATLFDARGKKVVAW